MQPGPGLAGRGVWQVSALLDAARLLQSGRADLRPPAPGLAASSSPCRALTGPSAPRGWVCSCVKGVLPSGSLTMGRAFTQPRGRPSPAGPAPRLLGVLLHLLPSGPLAGKPSGHAGGSGQVVLSTRGPAAWVTWGFVLPRGRQYPLGTPLSPSGDSVRLFPISQHPHGAGTVPASCCSCCRGRQPALPGAVGLWFPPPQPGSPVQGHDEDIWMYRLAHHSL